MNVFLFFAINKKVDRELSIVMTDKLLSKFFGKEVVELENSIKKLQKMSFDNTKQLEYLKEIHDKKNADIEQMIGILNTMNANLTNLKKEYSVYQENMKKLEIQQKYISEIKKQKELDFEDIKDSKLPDFFTTEYHRKQSLGGTFEEYKNFGGLEQQTFEIKDAGQIMSPTVSVDLKKTKNILEKYLEFFVTFCFHKTLIRY